MMVVDIWRDILMEMSGTTPFEHNKSDMSFNCYSYRYSFNDKIIYGFTWDRGCCEGELL